MNENSASFAAPAGDDKTKERRSICLSCGLCCDGTLFDRAPLDAGDDLAPLESAGFEIQIKETKKKKSRKSFSLPCVEFRQNCCQIYNQPRPAICGKYRCLLLKKYEGGNIAFEEAERRVARALDLRRIVKTESERILPGSAQLPVTALLRIIPQPEEMSADPELKKKWGALMLNLSALLDCLQTHFHSPRGKKAENSSEKSKQIEL